MINKGESLNMTIFLCGFMGCGKSTAGRELASMLGKKFIDMDSYIVQKAGRPISEIFAEKGEDFFRSVESEAVEELAVSNAVVACGGGAMLKAKNAEIASRHGKVVYMEEDFEVCYERISGDTSRPLVMNNTKKALSEIYNARIHLYEENSDMKIHCGETPIETAKIIKYNLIHS